MAKKNSSKVATQESIQNSQPRIQTLSGWTGVKISAIPLDTEFNDFSYTKNSKFQDKAQTDSQPAFLSAENNLVPSDNGSLESCNEPIILNKAPDGTELTGISLCFDNYVYAFALNSTTHLEELYRVKLPTFKSGFIPAAGNLPWDLNSWEKISITNKNTDEDNTKLTFTDMAVFSSQLIAMAQYTDSDGKKHGEMFNCSIDTCTTDGLVNAKRVPEPQDCDDEYSKMNPTYSASGTERISRLTFKAVWVNKFGSTTSTKALSSNIIWTPVSPAEFNSTKYVKLSGKVPDGYDITGVDIYVTQNENTDYIFCGHAGVDSGNAWSFNWLGAMADITQWVTSSLIVPKQNTTSGVDACYVDHYDGRLYFYGGSEPYRLYIGGNPGSELSVSTGLGGAFLDIEPGSGQEIRKVLKFRTYNGATTITALTYHPNSSMSSRYNILDTTMTVTQEYQAKGYTYERVDNVVGSSSYYGAASFLDGLYTVTRYGVAMTTMTQEHQANLRISYVSENIRCIFETLTGAEVEQARLLCINDTMYMILPVATEALEAMGVNTSKTDTILENYLFAYDTLSKSWYTISFDTTASTVLDPIKHIIHIDSKDFWEGIGLVRTSGLYLLPTTGSYYYNNYNTDTKTPMNNPSTEVTFHTHEISARVPITTVLHIVQLEFHFDYICCPEGLDLWIEGIDYYGRPFKITKTVTHETLQHETIEYMRVNKFVESIRISIKGKAHLRMTHINIKCFQQNSRVGTQFGYDAQDIYKGHRKSNALNHHEHRTYEDYKYCLLT